jgi:hypothetical protein
MTLTRAIARDPPKTRRFRLIAPVLVLLGLALLAMVPGILVHLGNGANEPQEQSLDRLVTYEGR